MLQGLGFTGFSVSGFRVKFRDSGKCSVGVKYPLARLGFPLDDARLLHGTMLTRPETVVGISGDSTGAEGFGFLQGRGIWRFWGRGLRDP